MAGLNHSPQAGQTLAASQPLIYANFITFMEPNFAVDHVGFNQGTDSGKHKAIHLTAVVGPTFSATEIGLSNVLDGGGFPVLNVTKTIAGPTTVTTDITTLTTSSSFPTNTGETNIASGLKYQWVQGVTGSGGTGIDTFSINFSNVYSIVATAFDTANTAAPINAYIYNLSNNGGKIYTTNNGTAVNAKFSILAIGVL